MAVHNKVGALPLFVCWALTAAAFVVRALATAETTPLILDTDDAMRLTLVHDLLAGQGWYDLVQHRLNTPHGAMMHWSRLIDLPEAALLFALRPVFGAAADVALAYAWPLLLLALLLWLTGKLALQLGGRRALVPALLLPAFSLITMAEFGAGRLDHHNVQILLALTMLYCGVASLERPRFALGAGLAAGAALTIGVESLPIVAATILAFGIAWVASARGGAALRDFGLSFALATVLGLAVSVPPDRWLVPGADAISLTYILAAVLCGVVFLALSSLPLRTIPTRLVSGLAGGGIVLVLGGPYGQLDPWLLANWIDRISEAEPWITSLVGEPIYAMSVAVPVVTALAVIAWNIARRPGQRGAWLIYGLMLTVACLVMLLQVRAARFAVPLATPACAILVGAAWQRMTGTRGFGPILAMLGSVAASSGIVVAVLGSIALAAFPDYEAATADPYRAARNACLMPAAFADLRGLPPERVMTPIDLGSHMLLHTPHAVVAAPYHRNAQGVRDTFRFFNGPMEEGRAILSARGITLVVICPAMREIRGLVAHTADSFVTLFAEGRLPGWLRDVSLPGAALEVYSVEP
jgi:MFS family permease